MCDNVDTYRNCQLIARILRPLLSTALPFPSPLSPSATKMRQMRSTDQICLKITSFFTSGVREGDGREPFMPLLPVRTPAPLYRRYWGCQYPDRPSTPPPQYRLCHSTPRPRPRAGCTCCDAAGTHSGHVLRWVTVASFRPPSWRANRLRAGEPSWIALWCWSPLWGR